jgi:ABC-type glycerol-3-phosphate transport system permease component
MTVKKNNFVDMLWNTIWMTFGNISLQLISSLTFAYIIARYKFPGRDLIYWIVIIRMMLVTVGTLPATYRVYDFLGITNSPLFLITNLHGTASFLIYYSVFKGMSREYAESAFVEGASHFQVFYKIMIPQAVGVIIATVTTSFIANWNEYMTFILYMDKYPSVASGIYYFKLASEMDNYPMLLAAVVMSIIPVVVLFATFQKQFINIDLSGGLKG